MSSLSHVIITASICEEDQVAELTAAMNAYHEKQGWGRGFPKAVEGNEDFMGGTKVWCCTTWMGCFNYLDAEEFLAHLATLPWEVPDEVRCFMEHEWEDCGFKERPIPWAKENA